MDLNTTIDEIGILETNSLIEKYLSNDIYSHSNI